MTDKIKPTESELEILNILWNRGPSTVRTVHEILEPSKGSGYTTTLKLMQIMHEKGLVKRDNSAKVHIFEAVVSKEKTQGQLIRKMVDTVFNGNTMQMVMQALGNHKADAAELEAIRKYLDKIENK
ncbi:MAG: BlaI/MecI/CopY family transcriptional regulator [Chitinophagaceae bacterium]|nr:BlaI/MecI/CopY family transcriptional regulator [Chitinophagaceae bacterium]MCB9046440.1 BlaI/MecI/CopY family transcriptional regulator [Chitinophagales bacterium]